MAIQLINVGQIANDGTGDDLREAMIKVNQNFEELDLRDDEKTTGSNLGTVGEGIFYNRVNYDLQFKRIAGGDNVLVVADNNTITISTPDIGITDLTVISDSGNVILDNAAELVVEGGPGISTSIVGNTLTLTNDYVSELADDTTPQLGGHLDAQGYDILNAGDITGSFFGTLTGTVNGVDPAVTSYYFNNVDFGNIGNNITNIIDLLAATVDIDLGSLNAPTYYNIDLGAL